MIDQKPRDPLYPQGFEDIDNLKNRQIPRPQPKENEDNDLKILKSFNQKLGKYIGPKPKNIIENEEKVYYNTPMCFLVLNNLPHCGDWRKEHEFRIYTKTAYTGRD